MLRRPWTLANPDGSKGAPEVQADALRRVLLALGGAAAALVLHASWSTVKAPYDAALTLVIVVGLVHGVVGWVPQLRIPARPPAASAILFAVVLLLFLLLTPQRLGGSAGSVLATRLAVGVVVAVVVHQVLAAPSGPNAWLPGWKGMAVLALLPGSIGAAVLGAYGRPGRPHPAAYQQVVASLPPAGPPRHLWWPS